MKILLAIIFAPLALLVRLAVLPPARGMVRSAIFLRPGAPMLFVASLLAALVQPAFAQQPSFWYGTWSCVPHFINPASTTCNAVCRGETQPFTGDIFGTPPGLLCGPSTQHDRDQCARNLRPEGPLCCEGYDSEAACRNAAAGIAPDPVAPTNPDPVAPTNPDPVSPDPTPDPVPPTRTANARDDNAGESTKGGALPLIAGGLFLAHYIISNATGDDGAGAGLLPEGLELDSHSVISHRNGVSGAHAGLTARYGDWLARISSRHSGASWARPDASLQWSYRSSSWEFRAYASQSGGAWDNPRAQIEWGWRF